MNKTAVAAVAVATFVIFAQAGTIKLKNKRIANLETANAKMYLWSGIARDLISTMVPQMPEDAQMPSKLRTEIDFYNLISDF